MEITQNDIIRELNVRPTIDPKHEIRVRINALKDYLVGARARGYVLGISGGQDSTLAGKLAQMAISELNETNDGRPYKFIAVRLPYGAQKDEADAQTALEFISPDVSKVFNIKPAVDAVEAEYSEEGDITEKKYLTDFHKGNVKARMRMVAQYAIAGENNMLVLGTDHAAEAVTGFFTKFGDGGADFLPLSGLNKRQGKSLLKELGAPESLYLKTPTADLLDNAVALPDEIALGVTYNEIDDFLEGKNVEERVSTALIERFVITNHKRNLPVSPVVSY
ncbi:MAG: ammonia-dependent NAD(+) synthetase [Enterococcus sp.]|nr:ammonia-dependent NAD(+) synthetase [Enterococcus sp.]